MFSCTMFSKKLVKQWTMALLMALLASGTAGWAQDREIVFNLGDEPRTIDPALNNAVDGIDVIGNIFEGLMRIGLDGRPEPGSAESWEESEDGLTWTFHLRPDLKWSDGVPLTAEDFRYGFLRVLAPENASPYAYLGYRIRNGRAYFDGKAASSDVGLTAVDDRTLRIDLEHRTPLLPDYLAFGAFMPARADVVEADPRGWSAKADFPCNGPFRITEWKHKAELVVVRNPHYWEADRVKLDAIRMVMIVDSSTALAAFRAGRVDFIKSLPLQMIEQLVKSGEAEVTHSLGTAFCVFNVKAPPFDNPTVRRAFTLAIDRQAIVEKILRSGQRPGVAYIPYGIPGVEASPDFRAEGGEFLPARADPEAARALLAEAGYPNGEGFPHVAYKYNSNPGNKALAEALQAMWKQVLGVEVELLSEEWKVFIDTRQRRDFQIARHAYMADFFDPGSFMEMWRSDAAENNANYSDPEYDALIADSLRQTDRARRMEALHRAEAILMRDLPVLPVYFYSDATMTSPRLKGVYHSPFGYTFFRYAEVAPVSR